MYLVALLIIITAQTRPVVKGGMLVCLESRLVLTLSEPNTPLAWLLKSRRCVSYKGDEPQSRIWGIWEAWYS